MGGWLAGLTAAQRSELDAGLTGGLVIIEAATIIKPRFGERLLVGALQSLLHCGFSDDVNDSSAEAMGCGGGASSWDVEEGAWNFYAHLHDF